MEEEGSSWIRRANFSHTICHRFDTLRLADVPNQITPLPNRISGLKSRPEKTPTNLKPSSPNVVQIQKSVSSNKQRTVSPVPRVKLSDTFKEARSDQKRFSTPHPRRIEQEKRIVGKFVQRDALESKSLKTFGSKSPSNTSPLRRRFASMKIPDKSKSNKESTWTKLFDHSGGRVTSVETAEVYAVDLTKLLLGLKFAHGAHSQLYHGTYDDEPVALKFIQVPDNDENGALGVRLENQFTREATLLSRLHHPNVIKFLGACRQPPVFFIVTEYLAEGSLRQYLHRLEHKSLPLSTIISMALDIARGMEYIHSQGLIHRDLKPENILISDDFHMKVADFGIACEAAYCDLVTDDPGTYRWMAPEMIKRKHYGKKVDVYGFGLILWELVAGTIPYDDMTPIQAAFAVVNKNMRPVVPVECPLAMKALIEQCWCLQPDKRPEFCQIVKVLEEFQSSIARDGTLKLVKYQMSHDHKKGMLHWIQKLGPVHQTTSSSMPKPKFT
ncbi:hypothetical protein ACS0TY_018035 [Phlomoides rotata]